MVGGNDVRLEGRSHEGRGFAVQSGYCTVGVGEME